MDLMLSQTSRTLPPRFFSGAGKIAQYAYGRRGCSIVLLDLLKVCSAESAIGSGTTKLFCRNTTTPLSREEKESERTILERAV